MSISKSFGVLYSLFSIFVWKSETKPILFAAIFMHNKDVQGRKEEKIHMEMLQRGKYILVKKGLALLYLMLDSKANSNVVLSSHESDISTTKELGLYLIFNFTSFDYGQSNVCRSPCPGGRKYQICRNYKPLLCQDPWAFLLCRSSPQDQVFQHQQA